MLLIFLEVLFLKVDEMQRFFVFYKLTMQKPKDIDKTIDYRNFIFEYLVKETFNYYGSTLYNLFEDKDKITLYCFIIPKDKNEVEDFESKIKQEFEIEDKKEFKKTEDFESYVFDLAKTF